MGSLLAAFVRVPAGVAVDGCPARDISDRHRLRLGAPSGARRPRGHLRDDDGDARDARAHRRLHLRRIDPGVSVRDGERVRRLCSGLGMFTQARWDAVSEPVRYSLLPMIHGTVMVTTIATLVAAPLGVAAALFIAEIARRGFASSSSRGSRCWRASPRSFTVSSASP